MQNPQEGHEAAERAVCQGPAICLRRAGLERASRGFQGSWRRLWELGVIVGREKSSSVEAASVLVEHVGVDVVPAGDGPELSDCFPVASGDHGYDVEPLWA